MSNFIKVFVLCLFAFGCKQNKQDVQKTNEVEDSVELKEEELLDSFALKVEFAFETDEPGIFQIKFNGQDKEDTVLKNKTVKEVNMPMTFSETFDLQKKGIPKSIYLILGVKKLRKVKVDSIKLITDEVSISVTKENLLDYFVLNQYLSFDKDSGILETHKYNEKHVPLLTLNKRAYELLMLY